MAGVASEFSAGLAGAAGQVTGQYVDVVDLVPRIADPDGMLGMEDEGGMATFLSMPLKARGKVIGVLGWSSATNTRLVERRGVSCGWLHRLRVWSLTTRGFLTACSAEQSGVWRAHKSSIAGCHNQTLGRPLERLVGVRGAPRYARFDNGPEFIAHAIADWAANHGIDLAFIDPGSPWQNAWIEAFNGRLRDELLNVERFDTLL